jgi:hypothetical protein
MITNTLLQEFMTLVDEVLSHIPADRDLWTLMEFAGPKTDRSLYPSSDSLFALIRETVVAPSGEMESLSLIELQKSLLRHSVRIRMKVATQPQQNCHP